MSFESRIVSHPYFKLKDSKSESMWDDFEFGFDKSKYAEYFNDFFTYAAGDWTITTTEDGGGGSASEAIADAGGGVLLITNDNGASDLDQLQLVGESILPAAGKKVWFESSFKLGDVSSSDAIVGLAVTDTSLVASAPANGIYFRCPGTSDIDFISIASSVESAEGGIISIADDTYVKVGFKVHGTSKIDYWINDVKRGSVTANIPTTEMRLSLAISNGTTAAETLSVDYVRMVQER